MEVVVYIERGFCVDERQVLNDDDSTTLFQLGLNVRFLTAVSSVPISCSTEASASNI